MRARAVRKRRLLRAHPRVHELAQPTYGDLVFVEVEVAHRRRETRVDVVDAVVGSIVGSAWRKQALAAVVVFRRPTGFRKPPAARGATRPNAFMLVSCGSLR